MTWTSGVFTSLDSKFFLYKYKTSVSIYEVHEQINHPIPYKIPKVSK